MPVYQFYKEQKIHTTVDEIWDFVSSPGNLKEITPDYMGFEITTGHASVPRNDYKLQGESDFRN